MTASDPEITHYARQLERELFSVRAELAGVIARNETLLNELQICCERADLAEDALAGVTAERDAIRERYVNEGGEIDRIYARADTAEHRADVAEAALVDARTENERLNQILTNPFSEFEKAIKRATEAEAALAVARRDAATALNDAADELESPRSRSIFFHGSAQTKAAEIVRGRATPKKPTP